MHVVVYVVNVCVCCVHVCLYGVCCVCMPYVYTYMYVCELVNVCGVCMFTVLWV